MRRIPSTWECGRVKIKIVQSGGGNDREPRRLPLRWAVIISVGITCGLIVGVASTLAGFTVAFAAIVALNKIVA